MWCKPVHVGSSCPDITREVLHFDWIVALELRCDLAPFAVSLPYFCANFNSTPLLAFPPQQHHKAFSFSLAPSLPCYLPTSIEKFQPLSLYRLTTRNSTNKATTTQDVRIHLDQLYHASCKSSLISALNPFMAPCGFESHLFCLSIYLLVDPS